jgi:hypothetical protein
VPPPLPCSHWPFSKAYTRKVDTQRTWSCRPLVGAFTVPDGAGCAAELYEMLRRGVASTSPWEQPPEAPTVA